MHGLDHYSVLCGFARRTRAQNCRQRDNNVSMHSGSGSVLTFQRFLGILRSGLSISHPTFPVIPCSGGPLPLQAPAKRRSVPTLPWSDGQDGNLPLIEICVK